MELRKWSGDHPGGPRVVERPSRRFGKGREALPKVQNEDGKPPRRFEKGQKALGVGWSFRRSVKGREDLSRVQ